MGLSIGYDRAIFALSDSGGRVASGIEELQQSEARIIAALDTIARALDEADNLGASGLARISELEEQLTEAREDAEMLRGRLARIEERRGLLIARMEKRLRRVGAMRDAAQAELAICRQANAELRASLDELRAKAEDGNEAVAAVRASYETELAVLRSTREREAAELDRLVGELTRLIDAEDAADDPDHDGGAAHPGEEG